MRARAGILLLLMACGLAVPARLGATPALPTAVLVVFLDADSDAALPAPPAALREAARRSLVAALATPGRRLCAGESVEAMLASGRVRSPRSLTRDVVVALAAECAADQVYMARLACGRGRLFLALRALSPVTGELLHLAVAERELPVGGDWQRAIGDAALELAAGWREPASRAPAPGLLVMPLRGPGVDPFLLTLVEEKLLVGLLAQRQWRIPEPAFVLDALREAGIHPLDLGATQRRALASALEADALLRVSISEYTEAEGGMLATASGPGGAPASPLALVAEVLEDWEIAGQAGGGAPRTGHEVGQALLASLVLADAESGLLRLAAERYLPRAAATGSFGRRLPLSWTARCEQLVAPLAADLSPAAGSPTKPAAAPEP